MKTGIHPEYMATKVKCNGCGTAFETRSTVPEITVEICSNCHPFYTGKQKIIDTAGRVDRFEAKRKAALDIKGKKSTKKSAVAQETDPTLAKIDQDLTEHTVPTAKAKSTAPDDK